MKYGLMLLMIVSSSLLPGCAMTEHLYQKQHIVANRDDDYLKSQSAPLLQLPAGMNSVALGNDYPVPDRPYPLRTTPVSEIPPGSSLASQNH